MDRAKKKLASALDGLKNSHKLDLVLDEKITADDIRLTEIVRHGFPDDPRSLTYDPVQRLIAIGTGQGIIRIFGDIGVDYCLKHTSRAAVLHMQFLVNEGALVTACRDDMIHLWNFRQKVPEVVHSIQLTKEQVTCINHPFQSKWLYLGTERGNVYFVSVATFTLSNYVINWNKAIDLSCRTHPGSVKAILSCPTDPCRLLLLYEKGMVVLWNLQTKEVDRFSCDQPARCVSWHHDGRQFMCGCSDGSLIIWNVKKPGEHVQRLQPHGLKCRAITQVDWSHSQDGEQLILFTGGMSHEDGILPALTVMKAARSASVLELDHPLITFFPLFSSPYSSLPQLPLGVAVLMKNDLLVIDLTSPNYLCFESINPMDIHESPVRCVYYFSNCPLDLLGALALVGTKQRRQGFSEKPWPITGGSGRDCATGHQELLLTGHEDGSLKFWQASGEHLQILYKLKTGRHFERQNESEPREASYAVSMIDLCLSSRLLLVAGHCGQLTLFHFVKSESTSEIAVVNVPSLSSLRTSVSDELIGMTGTASKELKRQNQAPSLESHSSETSEGSSGELYFPFKVRGGALRRPAGYQPELVCLIPWRSSSQPEQIVSMTLNSSYGIIAVGTAAGIVIIDIVQYTLVCAWSSADLYGKQPTSSVLHNQSGDSGSRDFTLESRRILTESLSSSGSAWTRTMTRNNTENPQRTTSAERRPQLLKMQSVALDSNFDNNETIASKSDLLDESPSSADRFPLRESVTSLSFIQSYPKKGDPRAHLCLWLGTSTGSCIFYNLLLPPDRLASTVVIARSGAVLQLKGRILYTCFMDHNFCLTVAAADRFCDKEADSKSSSSDGKHLKNRVVTKPSLSPACSNASEMPRDDDILQLIIVVSEEEVHVVSLPSYIQLFTHRSEISYVKAHATHVKGYPTLILLNAAGHVVALSLPTLKVLNCSSLLRHSLEFGDPMCYKTSFSEHGLGMYSITPSEMQKFTVCAELANQVQESMGELFVPVDMPEPPKNSFLKGVSTLFAGQKESVDLDAIFIDKNASAASGSGMRSVAKTIPGPSANLEHATARGVAAGQAANMALQALHERGEKLGAVSDATERLKENAMSFSQRSSKLVEKYEKKKWYNF